MDTPDLITEAVHVRPPQELNRPALVGALVASAAFLIVLINWSTHLQAARYTSDFYDVQARRLFHGHLSVPADAVFLEGFRHGNAYHLYFGLFPALLRMPVLLVTSRFDGRLMQPSLALAWILLLFAVRNLSWHLRVHARGTVATTPVDRIDHLLAILAPLLLSATPVLFLSSVMAVYHEAILWGLAASLWAFDRLFVLHRVPSVRNTVWFGIAAAVAINSRAALGMAPCLAALAMAGCAVVASFDVGPPRWHKLLSTLAQQLAPRFSRRHAWTLLGAALLAISTHVVVNESRFATAFSPPYGSQVWNELSEPRRAALAANGGSLFNVRYLPSTALAYLRPDGVVMSGMFPFVWFEPPATVVGDVVFDTRDRTASLTALSPLLVGLAIAGVWMARRKPLVLLFAGVSTAATFGVLTIGFIAQRYEGDLLLPSSLLALFATHALTPRLAQLAKGRVVAATVVALALGWSMWANLSIAWLYQRLYVPASEADRYSFVELQFAWQRMIPGPIDYIHGDGVPHEIAPAGTLYVRDDCASLLWSDGTRWLTLEPTADGTLPLCNRLVHQ